METTDHRQTSAAQLAVYPTVIDAATLYTVLLSLQLLSAVSCSAASPVCQSIMNRAPVKPQTHVFTLDFNIIFIFRQRFIYYYYYLEILFYEQRPMFTWILYPEPCFKKQSKQEL